MPDYDPDQDPAYVAALEHWLPVGDAVRPYPGEDEFRAGWLAYRKARICPSGDTNCPCPDGDSCHYKSLPGSPAFPLPKYDIQTDANGRLDRA